METLEAGIYHVTRPGHKPMVVDVASDFVTNMDTLEYWRSLGYKVEKCVVLTQTQYDELVKAASILT